MRTGQTPSEIRARAPQREARAYTETRVARLAMRLLPAPAPVLSARLRALA